MDFNLQQAIAVLERTPETLRSMLEGLADPWIVNNEGEETWSPYDVLGHLIHGERTDWMPRARIILEHGETKTFEPFDRWAQFAESKGKSFDDLLEEFRRLREQNLHELRKMGLSDGDLTKRGTHPELGAVTLRELLATWVAHDLDHIGQIARTMAKQYADEVGPWRAYLSILHDRRR